MSWGLAVLTGGERVIEKVFISQVVTFSAPVNCSMFPGQVPLVLNFEAEIAVILVTCIELIPVHELYHDGVVSEKLIIILRMKMEVCLGEDAPGG